mgnify:CR=1 FL=1
MVEISQRSGYDWDAREISLTPTYNGAVNFFSRKEGSIEAHMTFAPNTVRKMAIELAKIAGLKVLGTDAEEQVKPSRPVTVHVDGLRIEITPVK